jgi:hypothetical protein
LTNGHEVHASASSLGDIDGEIHDAGEIAADGGEAIYLDKGEIFDEDPKIPPNSDALSELTDLEDVLPGKTIFPKAIFNWDKWVSASQDPNLLNVIPINLNFSARYKIPLLPNSQEAP